MTSINMNDHHLKSETDKSKKDKEEEIHTYSRDIINDLSTKKVPLIKSYDKEEIKREKNLSSLRLDSSILPQIKRRNLKLIK